MFLPLYGIGIQQAQIYITMGVDLEDLVKQWLALDLNPITRGEIKGLWEADNELELERRLRHRIEFGTAGEHNRPTYTSPGLREA